MAEIWIAIALLGGLGLIFGLVLAAASKVFYVETDPRLDQLNACLPGANCGGCGYAGCDGRLDYTQSPKACYSLYADYYWYEIADTICIGDNEHLYYCFPKGGDVVAKTRLAVEEMYKLYKSRQLRTVETARE